MDEKISLDEEEVGRNETRLRGILKPIISEPISLGIGCGYLTILATKSEWLRMEQYKIYIKHLANFDETAKVKCPKCKDYHSGLAVWGNVKGDNKLYKAFQFDIMDGIVDECSRDTYLAIELRNVLECDCPNCNYATLFLIKKDDKLEDGKVIDCPKCKGKIPIKRA